MTAGGALASQHALEPYAGPAPQPLALADLSGAKVSSGDLRGEVVLLHFFATWCEPCRPELASLDRLAADAAARGLKVLAVSVAEPPSRVARFFRDDPVRFRVALDQDRALARAWGVDSLPSTIVLDRSGRPRLAAWGDLDWSDQGVIETLEPLLAEPDGSPITKAENGPEGGLER